MDKIWIIINNAAPDSWSTTMWSDLKGCATIYSNSDEIHNKMLQKMKKIHFGNKTNRKMWIPFKSIWDASSVIKQEHIRKKDKNFFIFQSTVKMSPKILKKLKSEYNGVIILYLPDTVASLGIAKSKNEFERYRKYYLIDAVYSFDRSDCEKYGFCFFDMYSNGKFSELNVSEDKYNSLFYIGSCRNQERYDLMINVFEKLHDCVKCNFHMVGADDSQCLYKESIKYNCPMTYTEVVMECKKSGCILELVNKKQEGNTLRFKEAVCLNKRLLTNNTAVLHSKYYNPNYIQVFSDPADIDMEWFNKNMTVDYHYSGEFSPMRLIEMITERDK